ncbi:hypothetical protein [Umezakia ovalisporum]|uniref:Uncharacterized protein n=1 Tax=Umezakia ovalisporum FSS-43 TaxID=2740520 RepID=A0ABT6K3V0_9CYAN|nr:hypothetical protein [Umezakia ovalisporum]MDH6057028.1 hypothetical protein [Umezakia ovalisporum FSS-43]
MPTKFHYEPTDSDNGSPIILKDIRLARSPHETELRVAWESISGEQPLGDDAAFFAVYLKGETTIQDESHPELQSVKGFAVHVLRRNDGTHNFRFKNNVLTIDPEAKVFYFKERDFDNKTKTFHPPRAIREHAAILAELTGAQSPYRDATGTCTDPNRCGHRNDSRFIRLASLG